MKLVFLWMFFKAVFFRSHVVFEISDEGEHGRHAHHVHHYPILERQHYLVMRQLSGAAFAIFCKISSILFVLILFYKL